MPVLLGATCRKLCGTLLGNPTARGLQVGRPTGVLRNIAENAFWVKGRRRIPCPSRVFRKTLKFSVACLPLGKVRSSVVHKLLVLRRRRLRLLCVLNRLPLPIISIP